MSGIYIKGIKMPKDGSWKEIRIYPDGTCAIPNWQGDCTFIKGAKAISIPDHGRLGDLDKLAEEIHKCWDVYPADAFYEDVLNEMPTIIPADKGDNYNGY